MALRQRGCDIWVFLRECAVSQFICVLSRRLYNSSVWMPNFHHPHHFPYKQTYHNAGQARSLLCCSLRDVEHSVAQLFYIDARRPATNHAAKLGIRFPIPHCSAPRRRDITTPHSCYPYNTHYCLRPLTNTRNHEISYIPTARRHLGPTCMQTSSPIPRNILPKPSLAHHCCAALQDHRLRDSRRRLCRALPRPAHQRHCSRVRARPHIWAQKFDQHGLPRPLQTATYCGIVPSREVEGDEAG